MSSPGDFIQQEAERFRTRYAAVREQVGRVIVGHDDIVNGVLTAMFVGDIVYLKAYRVLVRPCLSEHWPRPCRWITTEFSSRPT